MADILLQRPGIDLNAREIPTSIWQGLARTLHQGQWISASGESESSPEGGASDSTPSSILHSLGELHLWSHTTKNDVTSSSRHLDVMSVRHVTSS